jgi:hypothetical protein
MSAGLAAFDLTWRLPAARTRSEPARFALTQQDGRFAVTETVNGEVIYSPPDFIRATDPGEFASLLTILNSGGERIDAVVAYEGSAARCDERNRHLQCSSPSPASSVTR